MTISRADMDAGRISLVDPDIDLDAPRLTPDRVSEGRQRRLVAMRLQEIEGNPLTADDIEMFEREAWTHERCLAYILEDARRVAAGASNPPPALTGAPSRTAGGGTHCFSAT